VQRECSAVAIARDEWDEPAVDWLPLGKATFKFGIAADGGPPDVKQKPFSELIYPGVMDAIPISFSQDQLTELLEKQSGAQSVEIDQANTSFTFNFIRVGGGASVTGGTPWAILRESMPVNNDPRIEAEALFATEGVVRIRDADAEKNAKQYAAVRRATGLVWRQHMLVAFDRAVASGAVLLYARPQTISAKIERLPADAWPLLDVIDWQNGAAIAPDGTAYWSLHAGLARKQTLAAKSHAGSRRPARERARLAIVSLYPKGIPDPATEPNKTLCQKVQRWLKENGMPKAGDDSILRAAGRRK
jgi:hypothetical protein